MHRVTLRLALAFEYAHTADVVSGLVSLPGIAAEWKTLPLLDTLRRHDEWDVAEASLGKFLAAVDQGSEDLVGLPIFPSRVFRHSSVFVRADSPLHRFDDLSSKTIGIPDWTQTAVIYVRGLLAHECGVDLGQVSWVQGGLDVPGRTEHMIMPSGYRVVVDEERSLTDLLVSGAIDAVIAARPPIPFWARSGVRRLLDDPIGSEREYFTRTGVFPIMHTLVAKRRLLQDNPEVGRTLVDAFYDAKERCLKRMSVPGVSVVPLPWVTNWARESLAYLGSDPWPYGVRGNRPTLDAFSSYCWEQGVTGRRIAPDEVFWDAA